MTPTYRSASQVVVEVRECLRVLPSFKRVQELLGDPRAEVDVLRASVPLPVPLLAALASRAGAPFQLPSRAVLGDGEHDAGGSDCVHEGPLPRGRFTLVPVDAPADIRHDIRANCMATKTKYNIYNRNITTTLKQT